MSGPFEYPPPAFYFTVSFGPTSEIDDTSFKEVSGISAEVETEEVAEGGENRFVYKLPKRMKHPHLVVKRGTTNGSSKLVTWCKTVLEGGLEKGIATRQIQVTLMNESAEPVRVWSFDNAYPVKWEMDAFESTKNDVAIESIEFAYGNAKREM